MITGWLGGELVDRPGVGVHEGANLDAPSSLSKLPAAVSRGPGPGHTGVAESLSWVGVERRVSRMPAYAGVERRRMEFAIVGGTTME